LNYEGYGSPQLADDVLVLGVARERQRDRALRAMEAPVAEVGAQQIGVGPRLGLLAVIEPMASSAGTRCGPARESDLDLSREHSTSPEGDCGTRDVQGLGHCRDGSAFSSQIKCLENTLGLMGYSLRHERMFADAADVTSPWADGTMRPKGQ
jgi:hypothetical protein